MADRTLHLTLALAAVMIAGGLAGCLGPGANADLARLVSAGKRIAPGATAAFLVEVNVTANASTTLDVGVGDAAGLEVDHPATVEAPAGRATGLVVEVTVPDGTGEGDRSVRVEVSGDPGLDFVDIPVRVVEPEERVERNQTVRIDYTLRHPNGTVVATSIHAVANSSLPKDVIYQPPNRFGPVNVSTGFDAPFQTLASGMVGAGVATSVSVPMPASEAPWGNETIRDEQPRETTINRTSEFPQNVSRQRRFVSQVNESSEVGDVVELGVSDIPLEITHLDNTTVNLTLALEVGDHVTADLDRRHPGLQNPWPNSSELTRVHNGTAEIYTTPPVNASEPFTFYEPFANASRIASLTEHTLVVEHSPAVGLEYEWPGRRGAQTRTVVDVTGDGIAYERDNPHPLAGRTTVWDVAVLDAFETPPPQAP